MRELHNVVMNVEDLITFRKFVTVMFYKLQESVGNTILRLLKYGEHYIQVSDLLCYKLIPLMEVLNKMELEVPSALKNHPL
jgi:hypothetical protein